MKKLLLLPLLALLVIGYSCSSSDDNEVNRSFYVSPTSVYFDARNPEPITAEVKYSGIENWEIYSVTDTKYGHENPDWCKVIVNNDNTITITATPNESEIETREANILISYSWSKGTAGSATDINIKQGSFQYTQEELVDIVNKMIYGVEINIPYSIGNNSSTYQKEVNRFRIENGLFKYDGGVLENDYYGTLVNEPFELEVKLTKKSHETFYPYNLSEYITMTGDDGKDVKITGTFYLSDYVYQHTGAPANFEAGSFTISVSGGVNMTFSHYTLIILRP